MFFKSREVTIPEPGTIHFKCNICGYLNLAPVAALTREESSCNKCGSSVRMRGIIHTLSLALFGESLTIQEFPDRKDIIGKGMSDWDGYAQQLSKKMSYTNTYYHKAPHLDITNIVDEDRDSVDFLISNDVFEHVALPVSQAFINARDMLRENGVLIFSVPTGREDQLIEHFPNLYDFYIEKRGDQRVLVNRTREGIVEEFSDLIFHGGEGETIEMRVFSESAVLQNLHDAGFMDVTVIREPYFPYGIYWRNPRANPVIARMSPSQISVVDWGPESSKISFPANQQVNGRSAVWLITKSSVGTIQFKLYFGDALAESIVVNDCLITALIPECIIQNRGNYPVKLEINNLPAFNVGSFCVH